MLAHWGLLDQSCEQWVTLVDSATVADTPWLTERGSQAHRELRGRAGRSRGLPRGLGKGWCRWPMQRGYGLPPPGGREWGALPGGGDRVVTYRARQDAAESSDLTRLSHRLEHPHRQPPKLSLGGLEPGV